MGCCGSKGIAMTPLEPNSVLFRAQRLDRTANGEKIIKERKRLLTSKDIQNMLKNPDMSLDFKLILAPPFSIVSKLTEYIYLTGIGGLTQENLKRLGINLVINATYEWPMVLMEGVECIRVPVDDDVKDDLLPYFIEASEVIEDIARKGGKTLVHCMAGASRSTSIVLSYLIKYEHISLHNAFKSVQKRREVARPNIAFWDQLIKFEIRSRGEPSVRMVSVEREGIVATVPDFYEKEFPKLFTTEIKKQIGVKKQHISEINYRETKAKLGQTLSNA